MSKNHFNSLGQVIEFCTNNRYPFALYRLPGEQPVHCIANGSSIAELPEGMPYPSAPGFVFYPFCPDKNTPAYFIRADIQFSCLYKDINPKDISLDYPFQFSDKGNEETSEGTYCEQVQHTVDAIRAGGMLKVVLSRVQTIAGINRSPVQAFIDLCGMFGSAFVSLVYIPGKSMWLTVSPEMLISSNKDEIKTVALAGTKKPNSIWTPKELNEQQLVTDYVRKTIEKHCSKVKVSAAEDAVAGSLVHLKTLFTAHLDSGLWDLVMDLHPTPAVCGMPKKEAQSFIAKTELHKRKYYSGFLGPHNIGGETNFYVNLRCAELFANRADLFVGGGITADSVPQSEWEETVMKTNTLLPVLSSAARLEAVK